MDRHFAGEAGGGAPGADSEGNPNPEQKANADTGGGTDAGKKQDASKEGAKKLTQEEVDAILTEYPTLKSDKEKLAKKLGEQSGHIGTLKKFQESLKTKPRDLLEGLAKQAGLKVYFDEPNKTDLAQALSAGTAEEQAKAIQALHATAKDPRVDLVMEKLSVLDEQRMANQYTDWDGLGETRDVIALASAAGKIGPTELNHLAARGMHLTETIEAAKKQAVEEYIESLQSKSKGQIDGSRGTHKSTAKDAALELKSILDDLRD